MTADSSDSVFERMSYTTSAPILAHGVKNKKWVEKMPSPLLSLDPFTFSERFPWLFLMACPLYSGRVDLTEEAEDFYLRLSLPLQTRMYDSDLI